MRFYALRRRCEKPKMRQWKLFRRPRKSRRRYLTRGLQIGEVAVAEVGAVEVGLRNRSHDGKVHAGSAQHALVNLRIVVGRLDVGILRESLLQLRLLAGVVIIEIFLKPSRSSSLSNYFGRRSVSLRKVQMQEIEKRTSNIIDGGVLQLSLKAPMEQ